MNKEVFSERRFFLFMCMWSTCLDPCRSLVVSGMKKNVYSDIRPSLTSVCSIRAEGKGTMRRTGQFTHFVQIHSATAPRKPTMQLPWPNIPGCVYTGHYLCLEHPNYKHIYVIITVINYLLQVSVCHWCHRQALAPEWPEAAGSARCWPALAAWAEAGLTAEVRPARRARVRRWAWQGATWSELLSHGARSTPPSWTGCLQSEGLGKPASKEDWSENQMLHRAKAQQVIFYVSTCKVFEGFADEHRYILHIFINFIFDILLFIPIFPISIFTLIVIIIFYCTLVFYLSFNHLPRCVSLHRSVSLSCLTAVIHISCSLILPWRWCGLCECVVLYLGVCWWHRVSALCHPAARHPQTPCRHQTSPPASLTGSWRQQTEEDTLTEEKFN